MTGEHPIRIRAKHDRREACRRCKRVLGGEYNVGYLIGPDPRRVCFLCFERELLALEKLAAERWNIVDLAVYREHRRIRPPMNAR